MTSLVASISSVTVITEISEVSLIRLIRLFDRLGTARRRACGVMMFHRVWPQVRPTESPASHCPLSMPRIAPRMDSER